MHVTTYDDLYMDLGAYGRESDGDIFKDKVFGSRLIDGTLLVPLPTTLPGTDTINTHAFEGREQIHQSKAAVLSIRNKGFNQHPSKPQNFPTPMGCI